MGRAFFWNGGSFDAPWNPRSRIIYMIQKFIIVTICVLGVVLSGWSQTIDLQQTVPVDETIRKGVLSNGMTYYINNTDVVKDAASYYIIQNVGSVLENDDQRGLAHFLEHMAFNGTENFPGKGIINTLQEHGAVFGKDINAYTSFDETVYNLNHIPVKDGLVDTCLTILRDWSNYLLLTEEEIDAERAVVKEEWRTRQNGQSRLLETSLPITYNHSKYAKRLPIGEMSVIENFDYQTLRDFYHDWYRTDLQAIVIIGDIDVAQVERMVKGKFSEIPAVKDPKEREVFAIPENEGLLFGFGTDPEISTASLHFGIRHTKPKDQGTIGDLKRTLLESMVTGMLSERIVEKSQDPAAEFLAGRIGYGRMARTSEVFRVDIYPKPNRQEEAFESVMTEVVRAVKFGFTASEIERAIARMTNAYENQMARLGDRSHAQIAQDIQNDFLNHIPPTDLVKEYGLAKQLWGTLTPDDFLHAIRRLYAKNNRYLNVTGVQGNANLNKERAKAIITALETDSGMEPYRETMGSSSLMDGLDILEGEIQNTVFDEQTDSKTFVLDNGIKVHYKFVDKEKDKVTLRGLSYGGTSLLDDTDLPSARLMGNLVQMSGIGDFNAAQLKKLLAGKNATVDLGLGPIHEKIEGSSSTKDVETLLQLVHLHFVNPRFDLKAYDRLLENVDNFLLRRSKDVGEKIRDSLMVSLYGHDNPKAALFNKDFVDAMSFERMRAIYKERFANAADFEFFIVGDITEEPLKSFLKKYLASVPTNDVKETYRDNGAEWLSDTIEKDIYLTMEHPKGNVKVLYKKEMPYTLKDALYTKVLGAMLQLRVTETVRESKGGAYSPRAVADFVREPRSQAMVSISFDCNPDLVDSLVDIVIDEMQAIAEGRIHMNDFEKTRINFLKERQQLKEKNAYDLQWMTTYFRYGENIDDPKNFQDIVQEMEKNDIQDLARQLLVGGKSYQLIFKPKL